MPDKYGFDLLPWRGLISHRCIEEGCDFPGEDKFLPEKERRRHFEEHDKKRKRETERRQNANLALARKVKRQKEREEALIEERQRGEG